MTTAPVQAAAAAGPEIKDPTLTQQLMLDAPYGDDLCVISARGTGKSYGIVMLVARDVRHWKERYGCLIKTLVASTSDWETAAIAVGMSSSTLRRYFNQDRKAS